MVVMVGSQNVREGFDDLNYAENLSTNPTVHKIKSLLDLGDINYYLADPLEDNCGFYVASAVYADNVASSFCVLSVYSFF